MENFDVVTFGSAVVDSFVKAKYAEHGENILIPYGTKMLIKELHSEIGGGGTNTAVAFSRLGFKTGYIGKLGKDLGGNKILNMLKKEKITFLGGRGSKEETGSSIILVSREHYRSILTYKGINNDLHMGEIRPFKTKWMYCSSMVGESLRSQIKMAKRLKKQGTKIAFNPSEYLIKMGGIRELLRISDVAIVNKVEAGLLTKEKDLLKGISKLGPKIVAITDGKSKIVVYDGSKEYSIVPPKVKIIEKTGAGDAFASGFVAGLIAKKSIKECISLGIRESDAVVKHFGAKNNLLRMRI